MFAPVGFTPLSMLWDQFLDAKLDAIYGSSSDYYSNSEFKAESVRGSPLDIAEHIFLGLMSKCWPHAASANGRVLRVHSRFEDGLLGLFSQMPPYLSAYAAIAAETELGNRTQILDIAGPLFDEWESEPEEGDHWSQIYPIKPGSGERLFDTDLEHLRFHTLPNCYERGRFVLVRELPHWVRSATSRRDLEFLVENLGGCSICLPDSTLVGWDKILNGRTPVLEDELSRRDQIASRMGRPAKLPRVVEAYMKLYPEGHSVGLKVVAAAISYEIGGSVSEQTLRRATQQIQAARDSITPREPKP